MPANLQGQVGLISGGLGDIGRAIAMALAQHGANIAVGDVHELAGADDLRQQIVSLNRRFHYQRVDVSDSAAVDEWIEDVVRELGVPTLIIPSAAVVHPTNLPEMSPEQWQQALSVNLSGAFYVAHLSTKHLLAANKPGRIVFIGSWAGHTPHPHISAYCVSKAGLRMLCQCLAAELAPRNILVNEVAPGYVDAGLSGHFFQQDPELRSQCERSIPTGSLIQPSEVAAEVVHLCDPDNRHSVGATVLIDGGLSLYGMGGRRSVNRNA